MNKILTSLPEVCLLEPRVFGDSRGFFMETFSTRVLGGLGLRGEFVQDNHSKSARGILRGLHYQLHTPQTKLCRVIRGAVFDVAVDVRVGSPHFGQWVGAVLSAENKRQIWVPRGFAHGFLTLEDDTEFLYKCDNFYDPHDDFGIAWDDETLGISWPFAEWGISAPRLSEKDEKQPSLLESGANLPVFTPQILASDL